MKKLSLIALACLMVLGLAQCKKNEPTNNNNAGNADRVNITLTLDNGGQRVHPEEVPETGWAKIVYDNNDVVYVGSGGKYNYLSLAMEHLGASRCRLPAGCGIPLRDYGL